MAMLINRAPEAEKVWKPILEDSDEPGTYGIFEENLSDFGKALLNKIDVSGNPANGLLWRSTRYGTGYCAYHLLED